jgi:stearoyl-CoA desaturase (delta-9 desaturase)
LNRHHLIPPVALALLLLVTGGPWALIWGFFVSTVLLWHGTFVVNSLAHLFGRQRYDTSDDSRNNLVIALVTMGEGWHNNHHRYPGAANQGFFWWEIDATYYILRVMSYFGLIWDLRRAPQNLHIKDCQPTPAPRLANAGADAASGYPRRRIDWGARFFPR